MYRLYTGTVVYSVYIMYFLFNILYIWNSMKILHYNIGIFVKVQRKPQNQPQKKKLGIRKQQQSQTKQIYLSK